MAAFLEIEFPIKIGFGATGGPVRKTQVVEAGSGREERNQQWSNSRRTWDVGTGIRDISEAEEVTAFFEDVRGRLSGFRFFDPLDFKSCSAISAPNALDQVIGAGDGETVSFQLTKAYGSANPYLRKIAKPVAGSVLIAVDEVVLDSGLYEVDTTTGIVAFDEPPVSGASITAGFKFHIPVRFDTDSLSLSWENHKLISVPSIPIVELFL
ncbi:DUF2460 domain-containing protein [uncultured Cohaesibacter sp.]|uniref:DUF2460 domain-containing protein n=1 Tax=uncultured Cohaesibacter sp. TaxID=1002546 RepID=UPI0029C638E7|nr:DUF2460 domain-containing protein [uncultured Cohaesibacter sp.]